VDEAEAADRVVILHRGKVLREGTPAGIVADSVAGSLADAFLSLTTEKEGRPS
jgi:ABC-2 type transport system ATP-binding protein